MNRLVNSLIIFSSLFLLALSAGGQVKELPKSLQRGYQTAKEAYNTRDYEAASREFNRILDKAAWFVESYMYLGDIQFETGHPDAGISYYRQAIAKGPEYSPSAYIILANAEFQTQQYDSALSHFTS